MNNYADEGYLNMLAPFRTNDFISLLGTVGQNRIKQPRNLIVKN